MPVSPETYERLALEDPGGRWELVGGCLQRKPAMTMEHNLDIYRLERDLIRQLPDEFQTRQTTRVLLLSGEYVIPDLVVVPAELVERRRNQSNRLETYDEQ